MKNIVKLSTVFLLLPLLSQAGAWTYSAREQNGFIVSYLNPQYEEGGKIYFPTYDEATAQAFCRSEGFVHFKFNDSDYREANQPVDAVSASEARPGTYFFSLDETYVDMIFCADEISQAPHSKRYSNLTYNSDGSFTVHEPRFFYSGQDRFFYFDEPYDGGHCKLFGGGPMISQRIVYEPETPEMDTHFWVYLWSTRYTEEDIHYFQFGVWDEENRRDYARLSSITCSP